jgi:hypothetical protein
VEFRTETSLLKTSEASQLLRVRFGIERTEKTLSRYRSNGMGPAYLKRPDGSVFYTERDLLEWGQSVLAATTRIYPRAHQHCQFED